MCKNQECLQKASTGIEVLCKCLVLILIFCEKYYMNKKYYYYWGYKSILLCREFWPIWWQHYLGPRIPSCLSKEWINFSNLSWVKISGFTVVEFKRSGVPTISKQIKWIKILEIPLICTKKTSVQRKGWY